MLRVAEEQLGTTYLDEQGRQANLRARTAATRLGRMGRGRPGTAVPMLRTSSGVKIGSWSALSLIDVPDRGEIWQREISTAVAGRSSPWSRS